MPAMSMPARAAEVGVIGLGFMGENLALNIADHVGCDDLVQVAQAAAAGANGTGR